jgi:hypothetical protein
MSALEQKPFTLYYLHVQKHFLKDGSISDRCLSSLPVIDSPFMHSDDPVLQVKEEDHKKCKQSNYLDAIRSRSCASDIPSELQRDINSRRESDNAGFFDSVFPESTDVIYGNRSILTILSRFYKNDFLHITSEDVSYGRTSLERSRYLRTLQELYYEYASITSRQRPRDVLRTVRRIGSLFGDYASRILNLGTVIKNLATASRIPSTERKWREFQQGVVDRPPKVNLRFGEYPRHSDDEDTYAVYRMDNSIGIYNKDDEELIVLLEVDVHEIVRITTMLSNYYMYMKYEIDQLSLRDIPQQRVLLLSETLDAVLREVERLTTACSKNYTDSNKFGPSWDCHLTYYLAKCSEGDKHGISTVSAMIEKYSDKKVAHLVSPSFVDFHFSKIPIKQAYSMLQIYKTSPYPNADLWYEAWNQKDLYDGKYPSGEEIGDEAVETQMEFRAVLKYNFMVQYKEKYGKYPGVLERGKVDVYEQWMDKYHEHGVPIKSWRQARHINLWGVLYQTDFQDTYLNRLSDAASCPMSPIYYTSKEALANAPKEERLNLIHALQCTSPIDIEKELEWLENDENKEKWSEFQPCLDGHRGEVQKERVRKFFLLPIKPKALMSWREELVRAFYTGSAGFSMTQSKKERIDYMVEMGKSSKLDCESFMGSSDISKWSPRMGRVFQDETELHIEEILGRKASRRIGEYAENCTIFSRVGERLIKLETDQVDKEGMRGALLTVAHIAVMSLVFLRLKEKEVIKGYGYLQSFIDDIAFKVDVAKQKNMKESLEKVVEELEIVYTHVGLGFNRAKTTFGQNVYIMLNELFVKGQIIQAPIKAFMKMGFSEPGKVESLTEYINSQYASALSAAQQGSSGILAHWIMVQCCLREIHSRSRKNFFTVGADILALWLITPAALGGAGLYSLASMYSNAVVDILMDFIALVQIGTVEGNFRKETFLSLLNQKFERQTPLHFLRDPGAVMAPAPRLLSQRIATKCLEVAKARASNPLIVSLMNAESDESLYELAIKLRELRSADIMEVQLEWKKTMRCQAESIIGKFKQSKSIKTLIGAGTLKRIKYQYNRDVVICMTSFRRRL